jgi:signal transduction histidine kinase
MTLPSGYITTLMQQITTASGFDSALRALQTGLPRILPDGTRVDLLLVDSTGSHLIYSTSATFVPRLQSIEQIQYYYASRAYRTVIDISLDGPQHQLGWLVLAHAFEQFDPSDVDLARQIAAMLALRLEYERCRLDLANQTEENEALRQRLLTTDEMRLRATLSAGAAHDIGNLFASVMGHTQLIQQYAPDALQPDLRTIEQAARDGHHLLRRVLSSQIQVHESALMARANVGQAISDALQLTQPFWVDRPEITIVSDAPVLPPVPIHPVDVREVLVNLIMNAIAAMQEGGVLAVRAELQQNQIAIHVSDTGIGIAPHQQGLIFQPFQTTRSTGIGLGLSTAQAIVETYGGIIEVASNVGQGTVFTVLLPVKG